MLPVWEHCPCAQQKLLGQLREVPSSQRNHML